MSQFWAGGFGCLGVEDEGGITARLYAFCLGYFYWHFVSNPAGLGFVSCGFGGSGTQGWKKNLLEQHGKEKSNNTVDFTTNTRAVFLDVFIYREKNS